MRYLNPYLENIDWEKVEAKHIYAILGAIWIVVGIIALWLLITNSKTL